ncbi:MAG: Fic family protein [Dehalococcoidia bacterium]
MLTRLEKSPIGRFVPIGKGNKAYVPDPLPRRVELPAAVVYRLDQASRAVATLAGVGETIPNPHLLSAPFMRREAVLSSRIEGTQASLSDLFFYEAATPRSPKGDVAEVANYVEALEEGLTLLDKLPLSLRLMNTAHGTLMRGVRGSDMAPGELRREQVWIGSQGTGIGEARFVPPPPEYVRDLVLDWEQFANEELEIPPLVQCAMLHYQFETIHPYLDGNGRIGRLLIVLFLCAKGVLPTPLLYLSAYFERNRAAYYDHLLRLSASGDWPAWLAYFLEGVVEQANDALLRARRVRSLQDKYRRLLQDRGETANAFRLLDRLFESPLISAPNAAKHLGVTTAGARRMLERLAESGIVSLVPEHWPRIYVAQELLDVMQAASYTGAKASQ